MATVALILLCEEDIDPTGSDVRCVRKDRICDIILQLYLSAHCQITPLTKNETGPHMTQGKIDLRNESGRPMKVKVVGEVSEK